MNICILYGFAEGPWHSKRLRHALEAAGYEITTRPTLADIIIAHSGGCYMFPVGIAPRLVLLVGVPNRPPRRLVLDTFVKVGRETKGLYWFRKLCVNTYYTITRPWEWLAMMKAWGRELTISESSRIIVVRNQDDAYNDREKTIALAHAKGWKLIKMQRDHDDLWKNPAEYLEIIATGLA